MYLCIQTHYQCEFDELSDPMKSALVTRYGDDAEKHLISDGGLIPEFGRVLEVSLGYTKPDGELVTLSISDHNFDEIKVLTKLSEILNNSFDRGYKLVGWNLNHFDSKYLIRRYIINGLKPPKVLYGYNKWNGVPCNWDIMEDWRMGESCPSLPIVAASLGYQYELYPILDKKLSDIDVTKLSDNGINKIRAMITVSNALNKFINDEK